MKQIDARGLSCPQPVLITKKALQEHLEGIDILVDNITAKNNVSRFMKKLGYTINIKNHKDDFIISARRKL